MTTTRKGSSETARVTTSAAAHSIRNALPDRTFPAITSKIWLVKSWEARPTCWPTPATASDADAASWCETTGSAASAITVQCSTGSAAITPATSTAIHRDRDEPLIFTTSPRPAHGHPTRRGPATPVAVHHWTATHPDRSTRFALNTPTGYTYHHDNGQFTTAWPPRAPPSGHDGGRSRVSRVLHQEPLRNRDTTTR